jgi:hypothetical protein
MPVFNPAMNQQLRRLTLALSSFGRRPATAGTGVALAACDLLIKLVGHLQQHRGMSSAWLSGDAAFAPQLLEKQAEIIALFPAINRAARHEASLPSPSLLPNEVSLFTFRWRCLLDELATLTPEQSIAQHSQLITRVLDWLAALGERRVEAALLHHPGSIGAARNFARRLPMLTECLGQARAIGAMVAARHACPPVARVRLMFLIGRAEALLGQATKAHDAGDTSDQTRQAVAAMCSTVRTRMLLSTGVVVSAADYFALSTRAIDLVFSWITACHHHLLALSGEGAVGNSGHLADRA